MPAKVDRAFQIAITMLEAETHDKINLSFFSDSESQRMGRGIFGQSSKTFWRSEYGQATRVSTDTPHVGRKQGQPNGRLTLVAKGNCFFFKCGKPRHFAKECFSNKFPSRKNKRRNVYPKTQESGKSSRNYAEAARRNTYRQENL